MAETAKPAAPAFKKKKHRQDIVKENIEVWSMLLPVMVLIFIFSYIPLWGVIIAFQNYLPGSPFFDPANWVGLKHIQQFLKSIFFVRLLTNTIRLSLLSIAFTFWVPIIFALFLNEVTNLRFKKIAQTCSYLPYFVSSVVVAGMVISFLDVNGIINNLLAAFGAQPYEYMTDPDYFPAIYTVTTIWKGFGFESILYFSTLSSIDPSLYEAARIDGASHMKQIWHITLPGLKSVIAIKLIMSVGHILSSNTDMILLLYNSSTYKTADVIGTYVYRLGIQGGKFSYTTAVNLFMSLIAFALTSIANRVSNKLTGSGLW
ncbi:MAG: sugar ABC transporter permease [Clostridia bacterium]|nr:sugar ABC transporter permease [Clostridia bacterium]